MQAPAKQKLARHVPTKTSNIYYSIRKGGRKVFEIRYTASDGRRIMETVGSFTQAKDRLSEVGGAQAKGTVIADVTTTVADLIEGRRSTREGKASSWKIEDRNVRLYIAPAWSRVRARDVTKVGVQKWLLGLKRKDGQPGPLAGGTQRLILAHFSGIMEYGVEAEAIAVNPVKALKRKPRSAEKPARILGPGELETLLAGCGEKDWLRDIIVVTLHQALRLGEAVGLRWPDVDFENGKLTIQFQDYRDGSRDTPKGGEAATIDLMPEARRVLLRLHMAQGRPTDGPVFRNSYGGVRRYGDVDRAFRVARAGLSTAPRPITFHDLRHTSISRLANAPGAVFPRVQEFARHSKLTTTLVYVHPIDNGTWAAQAATALAEGGQS